MFDPPRSAPHSSWQALAAERGELLAQIVTALRPVRSVSWSQLPELVAALRTEHDLFREDAIPNAAGLLNEMRAEVQQLRSDIKAWKLTETALEVARDRAAEERDLLRERVFVLEQIIWVKATDHLLLNPEDQDVIAEVVERFDATGDGVMTDG